MREDKHTDAGKSGCQLLRLLDAEDLIANVVNDKVNSNAHGSDEGKHPEERDDSGKVPGRIQHSHPAENPPPVVNRVARDEGELLFRRVADINGDVDEIVAKPVEGSDQRAKSARLQEDDDRGDRDDHLDERSSEEVHELPKDLEDPMSPLVHEQIQRVDDPDQERHIVAAVRCLVVRCQVPRKIDKDDEDDNLEGDEGFSHCEAIEGRAANSVS